MGMQIIRYKTVKGLEILSADIRAIEANLTQLAEETAEAFSGQQEEFGSPGLINLVGDEEILYSRLKGKREEFISSVPCTLSADKLRQKACVGTYIVYNECRCARGRTSSLGKEKCIHLVGWREYYRGKDGIVGISYTTPVGQLLYRRTEGEEVVWYRQNGDTVIMRIKKLCATVEEAIASTEAVLL